MLNRTLAADQWAYYQAKSIKLQIVESQADTVADPQRAAALRQRAASYTAERDELRAKAQALDAVAERSNHLAEHALHPHECLALALAMTLIQIAISAASITALTRRRWLFGLAAAAAAGGMRSGSPPSWSEAWRGRG